MDSGIEKFSMPMYGKNPSKSSPEPVSNLVCSTVDSSPSDDPRMILQQGQFWKHRLLHSKNVKTMDSIAA